MVLEFIFYKSVNFMARSLGIFVCLLLIISCSQNPQLSPSLPQDRFIQVYFNHRQDATPYTEPYRHLERSGDNLESVIIEAIAEAKSTVDLAVQELNLPLVAKALVQSQAAGVRVRVILDNNYSRSISQLKPSAISKLSPRDRQKYRQLFELIDSDRDGRLSDSEIAQQDAIVILERAKIPLIDDTADGSKGSGLMHHKFMVIDGKTVVTGSANFTLSGIHGDFDNLATRGNINHLLKITNDRVARLFTREFDYMWGDGVGGNSDSKFGLAKPWRPLETVSWENTKVQLQFAPTSSTKDWNISTNGAIARILNEAEKSIDLALFVFSEQKLADVLQQQHERGVEIKGVFDPGFAYRYYSEVLDMLGVTLYFRCKAEADNNPWQDLGTVGTPNLVFGDKLHHKFATVDRQMVITGSQNWSQAANQINDETVLIIDNPTVARHFQQESDRLYDSAAWGIPEKVKQELKQQQSQCS